MDFEKVPKMVIFRQKVKGLTLTFLRFWTIIRPGEYKKLFARANIYGYSPGRIYMVIRPSEYKKLFARVNKIFGKKCEAVPKREFGPCACKLQEI